MEESAFKFQYVLIEAKHAARNANQRRTWKVANWIIHPEYTGWFSEANRTGFGSTSTGWSQVQADVNSTNFDLALLKVTVDSSILEQPATEETEVGVSQDGGDYVLYDSQISSDNSTTNEFGIAACLETSSPGSPTGHTSAFRFPSEIERFPKDPAAPETGLPFRATCYAVGHSPFLER